MISELSAITGLSARAIRLYEARGLIETTRDRANQRRFDTRARRRLMLIAKMRAAGVGLKDIADILDMEADGSGAQADATRALLLGQICKLDEARCRACQMLEDLNDVLFSEPGIAGSL